MRLLCCLLALGWFCHAQDVGQDTGCPKYPEAIRARWASALERNRINTAFRRAPHPRLNAVTISLPRNNFIDTLLFGRMSADGIAPAPLTTDAEFVRRVYVDLTGRIPQPDKVVSFLNDTSSGKRAKLIEDLLASDAYVSQFALYFANQFQVTRGNGTSVRLVGRNLFYNSLRTLVAQDQPYNQFVQNLLTSAGDADVVPGVNYFVRWIAGEEYNPPQDFWDDMHDYVTTQFLGFRTACVSCHNGRGHLENINLWLAPKRRAEFWSSSAFLARTDFFLQGEQDGNRIRFLLQDRSYGNYNGAVPVTNPGNRPQRYGANVTQPSFILNGAGPQTAAWRSDFVKLVTGDRQFARATVNYLWAYFFSTGIVDPPDGWDLARIDPENPPPSPWPVQNTQPELLEALADAFINSNYSLKTLVRTIANSNVYQLSSRYTGKWNPAFYSDFARHSPQRLSAEQMWDAIAVATQTEQPMNVAGFANPVMYANELPDPYEPWDNGNVTNFLSTLGRGNYNTIPRDSSPTLLGLLFLMNQYDVYSRVSEPYSQYNPENRAVRVALQPIGDTEAVRQIYLATLARFPSDAEVKTILGAARTDPRYIWLPRLQWALINKLEFIFNN
jgi:hypothetical protein